MYFVAANFIRRGGQLVAAAVVFEDSVPEPSFTYKLTKRQRTTYLYRRGDAVPPALNTALEAHIRNTAISWAVVSAHRACPPSEALALAIIRAVEKWVCRQSSLPALADTCVILPARKSLTALPAALKQVTRVKNWHTAAARALCRSYAAKEGR
jgi:hypothetical protein